MIVNELRRNKVAKLFKARLDDRNVLVAMLGSDRSLTVYPNDDESIADMTVIGHIEKQEYTINQATGLIHLESDTSRIRGLVKEARKTLYIKPIFFDETTRGTWD
jgi:hypothetical protein